ncbi:hypothetical protein KEM52_002116 [Ascosphaera acerosa]|nr:hypothetical protein KEM52_002116 [Ascosphaera acerosa]
MPALTLPTRPALSSAVQAPHIVKFTNCVVPHTTVHGHAHGHAHYEHELVWRDVWIDSTSGRIVQEQQVFYDYGMAPARVVDLGGRILAPGFIDAQLNGAFGFDYSVPPSRVGGGGGGDGGYEGEDGDTHASRRRWQAGLRESNRKLLQTGVTSYVPTVISSRPEVYHQVLSLLGPSGVTRNADDGAESLGAHVEGPFINTRKNGCHSRAMLREPQSGLKDLAECYGEDNLFYTSRSEADSVPPVKMVTLAPELSDTIPSTIATLTRHGIVVAVGHSDATYEQGLAAVAAGSTMVTHMFNAMRPFTHRSPGLFGLLGQNDYPRPFYGLICDGVHLHPTSIQIAYKTHPSGTILVTDAMRLSGMPDGEYDWMNGERIAKRGARLTLAGTDRIAGSTAQLVQCVNNFRHWADATTAEAIAAVTETPARMLGLQGIKGSMMPGADADFVVLADRADPVTGAPTLVVEQVWKFGKQVMTIAEDAQLGGPLKAQLRS